MLESILCRVLCTEMCWIITNKMHTTLSSFLSLLYAKQFNTTVCLWIPCLDCCWTLWPLLFEWLCALWMFLDYDAASVLWESTFWTLLSNVLWIRNGHCLSNVIWFINPSFLNAAIISFVTCDLSLYALWIPCRKMLCEPPTYTLP